MASGIQFHDAFVSVESIVLFRTNITDAKEITSVEITLTQNTCTNEVKKEYVELLCTVLALPNIERLSIRFVALGKDVESLWVKDSYVIDCLITSLNLFTSRGAKLSNLRCFEMENVTAVSSLLISVLKECEARRCFPFLRRLCMHGVIDDSVLYCISNMMLSGILKLELLSLGGGGSCISEDSMEFFCKALTPSIIRYLSFSSCSLTCSAVAVLATCIKNMDMNLSLKKGAAVPKVRTEEYLSAVRPRFLSDIESSGPYEGVEELDLSFNPSMGESGAAILASMLIQNTSLRRLNTVQCSIGPKSAKSFAEALKINQSLLEWDFQNNNVQESSKELAEAFMENGSLMNISADFVAMKSNVGGLIFDRKSLAEVIEFVEKRNRENISKLKSKEI